MKVQRIEIAAASSERQVKAVRVKKAENQQETNKKGGKALRQQQQWRSRSNNRATATTEAGRPAATTTTNAWKRGGTEGAESGGRGKITKKHQNKRNSIQRKGKGSQDGSPGAATGCLERQQHQWQQPQQ